MNVILMEPHEVDAGGRVLLGGGRARHLREVLGVEPGRIVRVGLLGGPLGRGEVLAVEADAVELRCAFDCDEPPPPPPVDLLLALPRPQSMKRLWPQLAALGVGRVLLARASRVESCYFEARIYRPERFRPLLVEGVAQAVDTRLPEVSVHRRLRVLIEDELERLCPDRRRLVAEPGAATGVREALAAGSGPVLLAVGPEGGWTPFELDLLEGHRFRRIGLGSRVLRTDTACVALLALIHDELRPPRGDGPAGRG